MSAPLVTIGVPVYRGADEIAATLESLRNQTYPHLDVVISVDTGRPPERWGHRFGCKGSEESGPDFSTTE